MPFNLEKANEVHRGKYDYSQVVFKNVDTKVRIMCPIHGIFEQTPYHHISRQQGCGQCKGSRVSETKRDSSEQFIVKARSIHGTKYDYSEALFRNYHQKVRISCPKHGTFLQTPNNHIFGPNGCPACGHNISRTGAAWLTSVCPQAVPEYVLWVDNKRFKVDGFDPKTNTVYEYFGRFWHGHPDYFNPNDIHPRSGIPFGVLYWLTLDKIKVLEKSGFDLVYTWGD